MSFVREQRWRIAAVVVALAVVFAGKQLYRDASANDLRWILAPTAQLVSWITGHDFAYEAGQGWMNIDVMFVIAPACAGVNFALAAFLALTLGALSRMTTWQTTAKQLVLAAALTYVATIAVNTTRIALAVELHRPDVHRTLGIAVYLAGLCGLYALARGLEHRKPYWLAVPLVAYVVVTLGLPLANGAAQRADFLRHATAVLTACGAVMMFAVGYQLVRRSVRGFSHVEDIVSVGRGPYAVVAAPKREKVYVTNFLEDTVVVLDASPASKHHNRVVLRIGDVE